MTSARAAATRGGATDARHADRACWRRAIVASMKNDIDTLRLGTHMLPTAESNLIKTLLRLFKYDDQFRWVFVDAPPYDALVVDLLAADFARQDLLAATPFILYIGQQTHQTGGDVLARPIHAEKLEAWLKNIDADAAIASAARQQRAAISASLPVATSRADTGRQRFKLRRWPTAAIMRNDRQRIRLATLLSRRALKLDELASLSELSVDYCRDFLHVLKSTSLLDVLEPQPSGPALPAASGTRAPSFTRKLIGQIRKRLFA